jgi:hypothetical protein
MTLRMKALCTAPAALVLAACGDSNNGSANNPTAPPNLLSEGEAFTTLGGAPLVATRLFDNGAILAYLDGNDFKGYVYVSSVGGALNDPGSVISGLIEETGSGRLYAITSTGENHAGTGTRYIITLPNDDGIAAVQERIINDGEIVSFSGFGSSLSSTLLGTATYSAGPDGGLTLIMPDGTRLLLPFTLSVDFSSGTGTFISSNDTHTVNGGNISVNAATGALFSTTATAGLTSNPINVHLSGSIVGSSGSGVSGIFHNIDEAIPSTYGHFIGVQQNPNP